jgi:hypothetical protein
VTLQAMAVYLFSIIAFIIQYFIGRAESHQGINRGLLQAAYLIWSLLVTYLFPIVFLVYVGITIKCRGYMSSVTGRMKELVRI